MTWDVVGILTAVSVAVLGFLQLRRSKKVDDVAETSGVASNHRAGTTQVIEGYQGLLAAMERGVAAAEKRCEEQIEDAVADLRRELTRRPTRDELLDANGKLRTQLLDQGITPINGISP